MRTVRSEFVTVLKNYGKSDSDITACALTFGELIANAIMHGPRGDVSVVLDWSAARPKLRVSDDGRGFTPKAMLPDPQRPGGRGLYIVEQLAGPVSVNNHPRDGCTVAVELPVERALAEGSRVSRVAGTAVASARGEKNSPSE